MQSSPVQPEWHNGVAGTLLVARTKARPLASRRSQIPTQLALALHASTLSAKLLLTSGRKLLALARLRSQRQSEAFPPAS